MGKDYQRNDWDSFEELRVVVDQLEICHQLLRSHSHNKARAAVILLDHLADVLMYRICVERFESEEMMEKIRPPKFSAKEREGTLFRFLKKLQFVASHEKLITRDDATVLLIGHRIRNSAYHRNYHNPNTIATIGQILYRTVCNVVPALTIPIGNTYSSTSVKENWPSRYGVTLGFLNYADVAKNISRQLAMRVPLNQKRTMKVLTQDIRGRFRSIQYSLKTWFGFRNDRDLNDMFRHFEFLDKQSQYLREISEPLWRARYLIHELHKDIPYEKWRDVVIEPEKRRSIKRAMVLAERNLKTRRRRAFNQFRPTVTAMYLKQLNHKVHDLKKATTLSNLLAAYEFLDKEIARIQTYVWDAESAAEAASDIARGK